MRPSFPTDSKDSIQAEMKEKNIQLPDLETGSMSSDTILLEEESATKSIDMEEEDMQALEARVLANGRRNNRCGCLVFILFLLTSAAICMYLGSMPASSNNCTRSAVTTSQQSGCDNIGAGTSSNLGLGNQAGNDSEDKGESEDIEDLVDSEVDNQAAESTSIVDTFVPPGETGVVGNNGGD